MTSVYIIGIVYKHSEGVEWLKGCASQTDWSGLWYNSYTLSGNRLYNDKTSNFTDSSVILLKSEHDYW